jgi:hypothetical protein
MQRWTADEPFYLRQHEIDLKQHVGPTGNQVLSNYFQQSIPFA